MKTAVKKKVIIAVFIFTGIIAFGALYLYFYSDKSRLEKLLDINPDVSFTISETSFSVPMPDSFMLIFTNSSENAYQFGVGSPHIEVKRGKDWRILPRAYVNVADQAISIDPFSETESKFNMKFFYPELEFAPGLYRVAIVISKYGVWDSAHNSIIVNTKDGNLELEYSAVICEFIVE